jgi:hypothetical protein
VTYDEELAERLRELLDGESGLTEKKMFGGLAFLIGGNMAIAVSGQGGVLVRAGRTEADKLVATSNAENEEAAIRLCGAVVLDINDEWASAERRYFSEASMGDLYPPRDDDDATLGELVPAE